MIAFHYIIKEAYWQKFPYDLHAALDEDESSIFVGRDGSPSGQQWRSTRWIKGSDLSIT